MNGFHPAVRVLWWTLLLPLALACWAAAGLRGTWRYVTYAGCVVLVLVIIGAATPNSSNHSGHETASTLNLSPAPPPVAVIPAPTTTPSATVKPSPSKAAQRTASLPSPTPTGTIVTAFGIASPDSRLTPGEAFSTATVAQICVSGYSSSVRDVTTATREAVFAEYGLSYPEPSGAYEVDHLIPLELGGDNSIENLWPEPNGGSLPGFPSKDRLENKLHELVCDGQLDLATAQHAVANDWYAAFQHYVNAPTTTAPAPQQPQTQATQPPSYPSGGNTYTNVDGNPVPGPVSAPAAPAGATAQCVDGTYSFSQHHQGTCSHHGGVASWL